MITTLIFFSKRTRIVCFRVVSVIYIFTFRRHTWYSIEQTKNMYRENRTPTNGRHDRVWKPRENKTYRNTNPIDQTSTPDDRYADTRTQRRSTGPRTSNIDTNANSFVFPRSVKCKPFRKPLTRQDPWQAGWGSKIAV